MLIGNDIHQENLLIRVPKSKGFTGAIGLNFTPHPFPKIGKQVKKFINKLRDVESQSINLFGFVFWHLIFFFSFDYQNMSSPSTQLATLRRMSIYEPFHQINMWGDTFQGDASPNTGSSTIVEVDARLDNKVKIHEFCFLGYRILGFFHLISGLIILV